MTNGVTNSFSVIFLALVSDFKLIGRAELSGIFSIYIFVFFCGGIVVGPMLDRFGPRIIISLGSALIGFGLFACSLISSPYQLYFFYGLITSLGVCCAGWLPNNVIITNWFVRRRGMAVGIVMSGNGISMLAFIPLAHFFIERIEWRGAFLAIGVISVLWLIPLNSVFQRRSPEDKGFKPDGDDYKPMKVTECQGEIQLNTQRWTLSNALQNRSFWMICFAFFCNPFANFTMVLHQVALVVGRGFEPIYATSVLGMVGIFAMAGRIIGGIISDRIGREQSYCIFLGCFALAVVFLFFLNKERSWILFLYIVLAGLGMGVGGAMVPPILADLFPGPSLGRIIGISMAFGGMGAGLGSWFAGYLYDITGNYTWALVSVLIAVIGAIIFVWIAAPRRALKPLYN